MAQDATTIRHWHSPQKTGIEIVEGDGVSVRDAKGNEYLDFLSQLYCVNAGHSNEAIMAAMENQLQNIPYVSSAKGNSTRTELAQELADIAPGELSSVFFSISGSEANESAAHMAREFTDSQKILTRWRSYHGGTYGAGGLTGDPSTRAPLEQYGGTAGYVKFLPPVSYRSPFNADTPEELAREAADHLEYVIRNEGADSVAAVLTEPIAGTCGAYTAPPGYFKRVREICDKFDVLLISDEVITGFGRCGEWFGIQTEDVVPDMITFAKGVTSAYSPLAGVIARPEIGDHIQSEGYPLGQTFGGHPVSCAAAVAAIDEYRDGILSNVREQSRHFERELRALAERHDEIGDVRGRGFHRAIEFTDPETGEPFVNPWVSDRDNPVDDVISEARSQGLLIGSGRPNIQVLLSPPLIVGEQEISEAIEIVSRAIDVVFR